MNLYGTKAKKEMMIIKDKYGVFCAKYIQEKLKHAMICWNLDRLLCTNFQVKTWFSIKSFQQFLIKFDQNFLESLHLWHTCGQLFTWRQIYPPSIFIVNVCWISNTRAADIILCFRSICIQTVAFWLYLTFIQQFGASYPVLPSPTMCYNKNPADSNITKLLFCDSFRLIYYCKREQYLC